MDLSIFHGVVPAVATPLATKAFPRQTVRLHDLFRLRDLARVVAAIAAHER